MRAVALSTSAVLLVITSARVDVTVDTSGFEQRGASPDCVAIGRPKPSATYVYQHTEPAGRATRVTNTWESVTETGSRLRADGPAGVFVQVNEHHIDDDVTVLDKSSKLGSNGSPIDT
ncbi:MAG TPA: hypothetical protein VF219_22395, partial [Vicinamibacterales bacterium]